MAYGIVDEANLTATANAIRAKLGVSDTYAPPQFGPAIASIPTGGGWNHAFHTTYPLTTTATSSTNLEIDDVDLDVKKILYLRLRDMAGPRNGYFYGTDALFIPRTALPSPSFVYAQTQYRYDENGDLKFSYPSSTSGPNGYGIFLNTYFKTSKQLLLRYRYNATNSYTIDGTFAIDVFEADYPDGYPNIFDE